MKALQKFTPEYLEQCKAMNPTEIAIFLDEFRLLHAGQLKRPALQLISIKMPKDLLSAFRTKCQLTGIPYQTQIKKLMLDWVK